MSILQLNLGTYPNDGQGDDLRTAFQKTIDNFDYLDLVKVEDGENLGTSQLNTHGVYADKEGNTLQFRSIKQGDNVTITSDGNVITIRPKDSINALEEDLLPKLGGNLDLDNNDIIGTGNINIEGEITADFFTGDIERTLYGNVFGDLTGTVTGSLYGPVYGNVTGQVSDLSNHVLSSLGDVSSTVPTIGQVLSWNGSNWIPQTVTSGVSRILPGNNITVSPSNGIGDVTISSTATGGGGNLDFGSFASPAGFSLDLGSF
jgi:hypothetical protein